MGVFSRGTMRISGSLLCGASALARHGVSREVPCSALKGETVPDSLPATPKSPPTHRLRLLVGRGAEGKGAHRLPTHLINKP